MFTTRDGAPWEPSYLTEIKGEKCIGCGRCYKVCARDVMMLMAVNEDDELVALSHREDRILLSRDTRLLVRRAVRDFIILESDDESGED